MLSNFLLNLVFIFFAFITSISSQTPDNRFQESNGYNPVQNSINRIAEKKFLSKSSTALNSTYSFRSNYLSPITNSNWSVPFFHRGTTHSVGSITSLGDTIIFGGSFYGADDVVSPGIIGWNGFNWLPMDTKILSKYSGQDPLSIIPDGFGGLYVAGTFDSIGGVKAQNFAHWENKIWKPFSTDSIPFHSLLPSSDHQLYSLINGYMSKWNGKVWKDFGLKLNGFVTKTVLINNKLSVIGDFNVTIDTLKKNVVTWNGSNWESPGFNAPFPVNDLIAIKDTLFLVSTDSGVFKWDGRALEKMNLPVGISKINGCFSDSTSLFLIGQNYQTSEILYFKLVDHSFQLINKSLIDGILFCVFNSKNGIIIGGSFSTINNVRMDNVARWDGNRWASISTDHQIGPNFNSGKMVVGDGFILFGRSGWNIPLKSSGGVLKWDGIKFDSLNGGFRRIRSSTSGSFSATGLMPDVNAMVVSGSDIYAGGFFDSTKDALTNNISHWNGHNWLPMGSGFPGVVKDILIHGSHIYVTGSPQNDIYAIPDSDSGGAVLEWDGIAWKKLGQGLFGDISKLFFFNNSLIAAGSVRILGTKNYHSMVSWDGAKWTPFLDKYIDTSFIHDVSIFQNKLIINTDSLLEWDGKGLRTILKLQLALKLTSMSPTDSNLYVLGVIKLSNEGLSQVVKWDGNKWTSVLESATIDNYDQFSGSMAVFGNYLYVSSDGLLTVNGLPTSNYIRYQLNPGSGISYPNPAKSKATQSKNSLYLPGYSNLPSVWEAFEPNGQKVNSKSAAGIRYTPH